MKNLHVRNVFFSISDNAKRKILKQVQNDITVVQGDIRYFIMPYDFGPKIGDSMVHFDENERIVVDEGPLKGLEGSIIKVDRRKQRAKIQLDFHGSTYTLDLGFEDISRQN